MTYSYDRTKTAAKLDVHDEWQAIVDKTEEMERKGFEALIKKLVNYFRSVGYDLDPRKSWLGKVNSGSDGARIQGQFHLTERAENSVKAETKEQVRKWVESATGLYGFPRQVGPDTWVVEIGE